MTQPASPVALDEPKANFGAWWMVAILLALYILSIVDRTMISMLVDPIKVSLKLSDFQMSLILGPAFGVFYAVFGLASGWAADRWSRRLVIFVGVFAWGLATMLCGFANTFLAMFAARALVAVGEATLTPAAYSLISDRFPRRRLATALSVYVMGPKAGASVAFAVGGLAVAVATALVARGIPILHRFEPWELVFFMTGAPGLVMAFLIFTVRDPGRRKAPGAEASEPPPAMIPFLVARRGVFIPLFLGFCCIAIPAGALPVWVPSYMARHFGMNAAQFGPALGLVSALSALALLPKGILVDWLYARGMRDAALRFLTWLLILFTPVAAVGFFLKSTVGFLVCFGILQAVALPFMMYATATIQLITPNEMRGRMTAAFLFIIPLCSSGLGPTVVGALNDFVFHDPGKVGASLAIVTTTGMLGAFLILRYALRMVRPLLWQADPTSAPDKKPAVAAGRIAEAAP